jgi:hypothetical protein
MASTCTNTIERTYLKVTNPNAHLYWIDIVPGTDVLTAGIKSENAGRVYPFTCNGPTTAGNKIYYFCRDCCGFFLSDDVQIITRADYIKETLNYEIEKIRIPFETKEMGLSDFLCELHKAITNSVTITLDANYIIPEWIESTRMSFVKCNPNEIYFSPRIFKDDTNTDIELWVKCSRPGIFIGRGGENIDYWRDLLQAYIDKWCELSGREPLKLGIRIEERDLFKYDSSLISL